MHEWSKLAVMVAGAFIGGTAIGQSTQGQGAPRSVVELPPVVVTGNPLGSALFDLAAPITVLQGEAGTGTFQYARASVEATASRAVGRLATSLTGAIGHSIGNVPRQRGWFVGGVRTVRGQIAGTQDGDAFWLARAEVGPKWGGVRPVGFYDIGWAGRRETFGRIQPQRGAGLGVGLLDGLLRVDIARGLYPFKQWRTDFYLSAAL